MTEFSNEKTDKINHIEYSVVEGAINLLINQNTKPSLDEIKKKLNIDHQSYDQIIEYYSYMWEQRHTATYLDAVEPLKPNELQLESFAKRTMQLEESLGMMRATLEATEDCLLMINKEGKLIGYNKKLVDFVGLPKSVQNSKDETEGLNYLFSQIVDPQELATQVRKKYQDPTPGNCGEMYFKDGRVVERYYQPQVVNEKVVGHVWSLRDVTLKRKQEELLRLTNRAITASTHGVILVENKSPNYIITYLNIAACRLFNLEESEALQKSFLISANEINENREKFVNIFSSEIKNSITLKFLIKNKLFWLEINIDPIFEKDQKTVSHFVCIINDITKNKELESILEYKAAHDALTGLPNKSYFEGAIRSRIQKAELVGENFGVLFLDIDRFKNINDTLGHHIGDQLLCLFSKRIQNIIQKNDCVARIGGDEFLILLNHIKNMDDLNAIVDRILVACRKKFSYYDHEFNITVSIGIVRFPDCGANPETLIRNSDIAMYQAKMKGKNRACFYTNTLNNIISRRVEIENELHNAILENQFELFYQPIFNINMQKFTKAEALIRWKNKRLGSVSPGEFIPIIEDIGMMTVVGRWVIETALNQMAVWKKMGMTDFLISINISAKQLLDDNFFSYVKSVLAKNNVDGEDVIFEITESFILLQDKVSETLMELNQYGIKIAIDDFGTGYSNLSYLDKLHVSHIKIDKSFIDQIERSDFNDSILLAIIAIAARMKFSLIAEGIETEKQYEFLKANNCDEIQGYYFSKPLPVKEFEKLMELKR